MVSLLNLPDVALIHLLEKCDYSSILVLRKTCWDLRNFIDIINPSPLTQVSIKRKVNSVELGFYSKNHPDNGPYAANVRVTYGNVRNGCHVISINSRGIRRRFLKKLGFTKQFFTDYRIAVNNPNLFLEELAISTDRPGCETFFAKLKKSNPIKTKKLVIGFDENYQLKELLSLVMPEYLEEITVSKSDSWNYPLSLENVYDKEQWKNGKKLKMFSFILDSSIQYLSPFDEVTAQIKEPTDAILSPLKNIFFNSNTRKKFEFTVTDNDLDYFMDLLGQPFIDGDSCENWFFKSPDSENHFCIQFCEKLIFKHVDRRDVPTWAEVKTE